MVEVKELAIIFKRKVTEPGVEEYIPCKIVEGYFDEAESWFVDKNENIYHHITEYMSSGNCYGSRKEISKLVSKNPNANLKDIKKNLLDFAKKHKYTRSWDESYKIFVTNLQTNKSMVYKDKDTAEVYESLAFETGEITEELKEQEILAKQNKKETKEVTNGHIYNTPKEIVDKIKETIKGQDGAIETIVTTVWTNQHYSDINKKNLLITGPTGSGKTAIFRLLSEILDTKLLIFSVPGLTQSGYVGRSIDDIFVDLLLLCDNDKTKAEHAIVILDELDKISNKGHESGSVATEAVQNELLKIIEGEVRTIKLPRTEALVTIDTSKITFVGTGAFSELYEKQPEKKCVGFITEPKKEIKHKTNSDALVRYGLKRELIGRLPVFVELNKLSESDLKEILINSKDSELKKIIKILNSLNISCVNIDTLIDSIAKNAIEKDLGARGLTTVTTELFTKIFYEVLNNPDKYQELILGDNILNDNSDYVLNEKENNKQKVKVRRK